MGTVPDVRATPMLRPPSLTLRQRAATSASGRRCSAAAPQIFSASTVAPTPRRPAVYRLSLHGDVVVDDHGLDLDALVARELGRHLEVHHVAGVVLDDVQRAGPAVDGLRGGEHLVRGRRGEHLARAGRVEHAHADEAAVHGLVAGAASGDQRHLAGDGRVGAHDVGRVGEHPQAVAVRRGDTGQLVPDRVLRAIDQLLHGLSPPPPSICFL